MQRVTKDYSLIFKKSLSVNTCSFRKGKWTRRFRIGGTGGHASMTGKMILKSKYRIAKGQVLMILPELTGSNIV